jgi:hypothetical protein
VFLYTGGCRELLEQYVSCRLATEVQLCVTGREQGIKTMAWFAFFVQVHVQSLTVEQQGSIIKGRFAAKVLEGAPEVQRIAAFTKQLRGNSSFVELAQNPLLLNLLVSEYMLHERVGGDDNIYFEGRCVPGQKDYVGSFPGVHKREWDRVTMVLEKTSVACVFIPEENPQYGMHDEDPEHHGKCFCESYLYYDAPEWVQRNMEFIIDASNVHVGEDLPNAGKKIEALVQLPKWPEMKYWICTVVHAVTIKEAGFKSFTGYVRGASVLEAAELYEVVIDHGQHELYGHTKPHFVKVNSEEFEGQHGSLVEYSEELHDNDVYQVQLECNPTPVPMLGKQLALTKGIIRIAGAHLEDTHKNGFVKVSFDGLGRAKKPDWIPISDINQSGYRKTAQRPLQAPFGCRWYAGWTEKVHECEADGQRAIVVYKKGKTGIKTFEGLGASQLKEVAYLEKHFYPNKNYTEVDATEFEAQVCAYLIYLGLDLFLLFVFEMF